MRLSALLMKGNVPDCGRIVAMLMSLAIACDATQAQEIPIAKTSRALFVACTEYVSPKIRSLKGPANDVNLFRDLLIQRYGFSADHIVVLMDGLGSSHRATRANIVREIEALIRQTSAGDQIVLFLAGHGSQQPDQTPPDPDDPESDGLDEVFLPADTGSWNEDSQTIDGAIIDDELREWLQQLLTRQAEVIVVMDCCHAGTGVRGDDLIRRIEPERLVPADLLQRIRQQATAAGDNVEQELLGDPLGAGEWVAIYAAQADELEIETLFPRQRTAKDRRYYGLLSYAMHQVLSSEYTPSYRELIQRVQARYLAWGRFGPTPMVEGTILDRSLLGRELQPRSYTLRKYRNGSLRLQAGQVHGLTNGTILTVDSSNDQRRQPVGHVRITEAGLGESLVEPCRFGNQPLESELPQGGLCRPVSVAYGDQRMVIAFDRDSAPPGRAEIFRAALQKITSRNDPPIRVAENIEESQWVAAFDESQWVLTTLNAVSDVAARAPRVALSVQDQDDLERQLRQVARVQTLLGLASNSAWRSSEHSQLAAELKMYVQRSSQQDGRLVAIGDPPTLHSGDRVWWEINNEDKFDIDVTLLFIDAACGISLIEPQDRWGVCRIASGSEKATIKYRVNTETTGWEHVALLAVRAHREPVNFAFLAQPTWEAAQRELASQRGMADVLESPLGSLLADALFHPGGRSRSVDSQLAQEQRIEIRSWMTEKRPERVVNP